MLEWSPVVLLESTDSVSRLMALEPKSDLREWRDPFDLWAMSGESGIGQRGYRETGVAVVYANERKEMMNNSPGRKKEKLKKKKKEKR